MTLLDASLIALFIKCASSVHFFPVHHAFFVRYNFCCFLFFVVFCLLQCLFAVVAVGVGCVITCIDVEHSDIRQQCRRKSAICTL